MTDKETIAKLQAEIRRLEKRCGVYAILLRGKIENAVKDSIDKAVK
jgi:hypothetical protein